MPDTLSKALLNRVLRSDFLRTHMQEFYLVSGMEVLILDALGTLRMSWPRQSAMSWRRVIETTSAGGQVLQRARQELLARLEQGENAGLSRACGLLEIGCRMHMDGRTVGFWLLSAGREPKGGLEETEGVWKEQAKQGGGVSWPQWRQAWEETPVCTRPQGEIWGRWLAKAAAELHRHLEEVTAPDPGPRTLPVSVRQACEWVREHHADPIRLQDVAARCGISSEHLSRLFHQSTGLRFREFLSETRLNQACTQLSTTPDRVADIAARSGFSTLSRFNQAFRTHTGLTPREWRKRRTGG